MDGDFLVVDRMAKRQTGKGLVVKTEAIADLPSRFGKFKVIAFSNNRDEKDHAAFVKGSLFGKSGVPVRIQSECLTGDMAGSLRCDCRDQLEESFRMINKNKLGIFIYLRQEGRGIGFMNKIKAYALQDQGLDTVEANLALGLRDDTRDYSIAAEILKCLKVKSIRLMSNNPKKFVELEKKGVKIAGRIPVETKPRPENLRYLVTKRDKQGHMFSRLPKL